MNLFARISAAIQGFRSGSSRARVPDWSDFLIGHPFIPPEQLDEDFREAFRKVPMVAAAISRVQHDVASLPWRVYQGTGPKRKEQQRKDGNLADLLMGANPRDTGYQLRVDTVGALKTHGNAFWFLQRFNGGPPAELWNLKPHLMQVEPSENRGIVRYFYNRNATRNAEIDPKNIIHFRKFNPDDHPVGMSELEPVRKDYEAQFYALIWLKEFFKKGGMVAGVWALKEGGKKLTDKEVKAITDRLKERHVGYNKAWDPIVTEGLEFIKRGLTLSEMEIDRQLAIMNADICRAIGVPPWMMGIKEGSNLGTSGAGVDQLDYVFGTLKREATLIDSVVNEQLVPLFGDGLEVETDFSGNLAVQGALLQQATSLVTASGRPILTVNEARKRMGLEEHEDPTADELYVRAVTAPFGADGSPGGPVPGAGGTDAPPASRSQSSRTQAMIDGNAHREQLRRRAASALQNAEARMLAFVNGRLKEQEATIQGRLEDRYLKQAPTLARRKGKFAIDLDNIMEPATSEDEARARRILKELLRERGVEAINELGELVDLAEAIEINLNSERVARFLDAQVNRAIIVPDGTTAQMLRESLAEGVQANETLSELAARVRSVFEARGNMAATIARTETLPGFNLATQEAWEATGVVEQQEWLTARDDQVRPAHAEVDGDAVPLGSAFTVGGEPLLYPGDPSGSIGNTANCRCTMIPVISQNASQQKRWSRFWKDPHTNGNGVVPANRMRKWFKVEVQ